MFGRELNHVAENQNPGIIHKKSFYKNYEHPIHHWGMVINLDACTSCNACVVACQAENNVPVVGKEEVKRGHDMHWIKIDRYYEGNMENPDLKFQPVLCQHCDQAPCENVCPVSATTHSSEGLNQMIYNRCIGTRYCANNCPYKVRRFNWFDYTGADFIHGNEYDKLKMTSNLPRMVLNPDVTIRSKGVIEKCSFCIQRIQSVKNKAKKEARQINDGEVETACMQVCPANAITFGDLNDKNSKVFKLKNSPDNYDLLGELGTKPSVSYMENKEINKKMSKSLSNITNDIIRPIEGRPNKYWYILFIISLAAFGFGLYYTWLTIFSGIGEWGLNRSVGWGWAIVNFVWWIGIGHAGTFISAILLLFRQKWRSSINRAAEAMTIIAIMCAAFFPLIHLGRSSARFYMFSHT